MNTSLKIGITTTIGMIGGAVAKFLGGWSSDLITLLIFMGVDLLSGLAVAGIFHKSEKTTCGAIESNTMFKGIVKKVFMIFIVALLHRLDITLGITFLRTAVIIGFIANEFMSIIENVGLMGVPLPSVVKKALELLKEQEDK